MFMVLRRYETPLWNRTHKQTSGQFRFRIRQPEQSRGTVLSGGAIPQTFERPSAVKNRIAEYSGRDTEHNNAVALKEYLEAHMSHKKRQPTDVTSGRAG